MPKDIQIYCNVTFFAAATFFFFKIFHSDSSVLYTPSSPTTCIAANQLSLVGPRNSGTVPCAQLSGYQFQHLRAFLQSGWRSVEHQDWSPSIESWSHSVSEGNHLEWLVLHPCSPQKMLPAQLSCSEMEATLWSAPREQYQSYIRRLSGYRVYAGSSLCNVEGNKRKLISYQYQKLVIGISTCSSKDKILVHQCEIWIMPAIVK